MAAPINLSQERQRRQAAPPLPVNPLEQLPCDVEAEQATIGSILLNREAILAIKDWLTPERLYLAKHRQIYEAALHLVAQGVPPDIRTVASELRVRGQLEAIGGIGYLTELAQSAPTSFHIQHYAESVDRTGWQRELIQAASKLVATAYQNASQAAADIEQINTVAANRRHHSVRIFHISELWSEQFPPLQVLIDGILYEGVTLFSGKPKMGKSLLTIDVGAAIAAGGMALGGVPVSGGPVLYLCLEDPTAALQERLESVLRGRPNIPFFYQTQWPALDSGGLSAIQGWLDEHLDAKLIVIDTLASIAPAPDARKTSYQADYDSLKHLQRIAAKRPGLAIIVNTHSRKAGADDVLDEISGTTGKSGAVDHVWVMRRVRGENEAELHVQPRRAASSVRALTFDETLITWRIGGDAEATKTARLRQELLEALADEDLWPSDLASLLDMDTEQGKAKIRQQCSKLLKAKLVEKIEKGKYRLSRLGQQELVVTSSSENNDRGDRKIGDRNSEHGYRQIAGFDEPTTPDNGVPISDLPIHGNRSLIALPQPDKESTIERVLKPIAPQQRFFVRIQINSNKDSDQQRARLTCEQADVDYSALYTLIRGHAPPEPSE